MVIVIVLLPVQFFYVRFLKLKLPFYLMSAVFGPFLPAGLDRSTPASLQLL